jgi:hypothetical protein
MFVFFYLKTFLSIKEDLVSSFFWALLLSTGSSDQRDDAHILYLVGSRRINNVFKEDPVNKNWTSWREGPVINDGLFMKNFHIYEEKKWNPSTKKNNGDPRGSSNIFPINHMKLWSNTPGRTPNYPESDSKENHFKNGLKFFERYHHYLHLIFFSHLLCFELPLIIALGFILPKPCSQKLPSAH